MLIAVLTIGGVASVITIAALLGKARTAPTSTQPKVRPLPADNEPDPNKKVTDEASEAIGGASKIVGQIGEKVTGILGSWTAPEDPDYPIDDPEPMPPAGPDPYEPSPVPRSADYYQVIAGDTLWEMARAAFGSGSRYPEIVAAPENQWIGKYGNPWKGGLYPKYSGWNTQWGSGTRHPVVYIP